MLLDLMAQGLLLEREYILGLASSASHRYRRYSKEKRKGGHRIIYHPSRELKALQRWLVPHVIDRLPVHDAAMAYRRGRSILANAAVHQGSSFLLRMDLEEFFPSLVWEDIERHLAIHRELLPQGWDDEDSRLFCSVVCRDRRLTIGAVTSPSLSNTLCYQLDHELAAMAEERDVMYSRYADDLFFSTAKPRILSEFQQQVQALLVKLAYPRLSINREKTYHSSKRGRRTVTGLVLTSDGGVSLGRPLKRRLRSLIYRWESLNDREREALAGWLAFSKSIEPEFMDRLEVKYGAEKLRKAMLPPPDGEAF